MIIPMPPSLSLSSQRTLKDDLTSEGQGHGDITGALSDQQPYTQGGEESRVSELSGERASLLARKFTQGNSLELQARLAIVNQRLWSLTPQVTEDDVTRLERSADQLEALTQELDAIGRELDE